MSALLLTLFGCFGTDQGKGKFFRFNVMNESGKVIKIAAYLSQYPKVAPIITTLDIGETITKTHQDGLPPSSPYSYGAFLGDGENRRDSLKIIYSNSKIQFFTMECSEDKRNPLNFCVYNGTEETYIFTEEDYENAIPCNEELN